MLLRGHMLLHGMMLLLLLRDTQPRRGPLLLRDVSIHHVLFMLRETYILFFFWAQSLLIASEMRKW